MHGYQRDDGLFEIEGRVTDTKTYPFSPYEGGRLVAPGEALHDMWVRLVIDDTMLVHEVLAVTDSHPYPQCPEAAAALAGLKGLRIASGWAKAVNERLGGVKGCTHLREILMPLASAAYQTLTSTRMSREQAVDASGRPLKIDSCYAYATHREQVQIRWPKFHKASADAKSG